MPEPNPKRAGLWQGWAPQTGGGSLPQLCATIDVYSGSGAVGLWAFGGWGNRIRTRKEST